MKFSHCIERRYKLITVNSKHLELLGMQYFNLPVGQVQLLTITNVLKDTDGRNGLMLNSLYILSTVKTAI
jgi:hypothetical protein